MRLVLPWRATAIALLAISIPFVWQSRTRTSAATAAPRLRDAGGVARLRRRRDAGACMANAKPANWDFKLKDLDGKEVSLASFKGKVVLLNFWATWCGPCKAEIPGFVELQEKYRDKLTIIGYSVDDTAELAKKYADAVQDELPDSARRRDERTCRMRTARSGAFPRRSSSARTATCAASTWALRRKPCSKKKSSR